MKLAVLPGAVRKQSTEKTAFPPGGFPEELMRWWAKVSAHSDCPVHETLPAIVVARRDSSYNGSWRFMQTAESLLDGRVSYRDQILSRLAGLRWSLLAVETDGDWWLDEEWKLRSEGESYGLELHVTFVVEPQWEGNRKKGQGICCVRASHGPLECWSDKSTLVAEIWMSKRRFDVKLTEFEAAVRAYQRSAV